MEKSDQILAFIRQRGPVVPSQVASEIGTDIMIASAMLSDISSSGKIKISSLKMGGSPFYYCDGQEAQLQNFLKYLNSKQIDAYNLLKEGLILRDKDLTPVTRVALREIKDFAKQLEVSLDGAKEIFWKWFALGREEAEDLIKKKLGIAEKETQQQLSAPSVQTVITPKRKEAKPVLPSGTFFDEIMNFFTSNSIEVIDRSLLKKNEFEFTIKFSTPVGEVKYYCVAKGKKRCDADDLTSAFARGQMRNLPVLFISHGALSKDAEALLAKGLSITFKKI